jgi:hypothetical protein
VLKYDNQKCETIYCIVVMVIPNYIKTKKQFNLSTYCQCFHFNNWHLLEKCQWNIEISKWNKNWFSLMSQYQIVTIQNIIKCPAMKNKFLIYYNKNVNLYNKQYNNSCTFVNYCVVLVNYSVVRLLMISIRYSE